MAPEIKEIHKTIAALPNAILADTSADFLTFDEFRNEALRAIQSLRDQIKQVADGLGRSPDCVLRNLIATASPAELTRICELLRFWVREAPKDTKEFRDRELLQHLPRSSGEQSYVAVVRWILRGGKAPKLSQAAQFFGRKLRLIVSYQREVLNAGGTMDARETAELLSILKSSGTLWDEAEARKVLVKEGFAKGFPPLSKKLLNKLSPELRQWILKDQAFSKFAIEPDLFDRVWSDPLKCGDTPQALERSRFLNSVVPGALSALSARLLSSGYIEELFDSKEARQYSDQIKTALLKPQQTKNVWRTIKDNCLQVDERRLKKFDKCTSNLLQFYWWQKHRRLSFAATLGDAQFTELVTSLPKEDLVAAIRSTNSANGLRRLMAEGEKFKALVLHNDQGTRAFLSCIAIDRLAGHNSKELVTLLWREPKLFRNCRIEHLLEKRFRLFLTKVLSEPKELASFLAEAPPAVLGMLANSDDLWVATYRRKLARKVAKLPKDDLLARAFRRLQLQGECYGDVQSGQLVSQEAFDFKLRLARRGEYSGDLATLLTLVDQSGTEWWRRSITSKSQGRSLIALIRKHRPEYVPTALSLYAKYLWAQPDFRGAFTGFLRGKKSWREMGLSRRLLREFIPATWEQYRNTPTLATAFTLSLAFAPEYMRLLVSLCMRRFKSANKDNRGRVFDDLYQTKKIRKKSGGFRELHIPDAKLKRLQRSLLRYGFDGLPLDEAVHGFRQGRSILSNAQPHVGKPCVVNVDIDSFFESTVYAKVLRACSVLVDRRFCPYGHFVLADLCCFGGKLPTGAPTSPAIANFALVSADKSIGKAAHKHGITYTRYADDLTFSGDGNTPKILPFVEKVLGQAGYKLKQNKTNIYRRGRRQMVTGLVVNDKPNVARRIRRRLRAAVHSVCTEQTSFWNGRTMNMNELQGRLAFLAMVQPQEAAALQSKLARLKRKKKKGSDGS